MCVPRLQLSRIQKMFIFHICATILNLAGLRLIKYPPAGFECKLVDFRG